MNSMKPQYLMLAVSLALGSVPAVTAGAAAALPTAAATVEIPKSKGGFDFLRVDSKRHRLLAAHEKDGTSDFIDLDKNTLITRVKLGTAVDTALDADGKFYFISVQEGERVPVVDATTLKEVKSIKVAGPTDAIILDPKNRNMYVAHDEGADVWVIDPSSAKVVATIAIPGVPEFMVYDQETDRIYLNIKDKDVVAVIDPSAGKVVAQWPTGAAKSPHGMALDAATHRIFVAGGTGKLVAIDTRTGAITANADIVPKVDQIAYDSAGALVYCAAPDKMSVLSAEKGGLTALGDLDTAPTAKNVTVDPATRAVWTTYTDGKNAYAKSWMPPTK